MSVERLELSTNGLKGRCSTVELHARDGTFYHAAGDASIAVIFIPSILIFQQGPAGLLCN